MDYCSVCLVFLIFACILEFSAGQNAVPEITFQAFTPHGLSISIPAEKGVELFAFHGKIDKPIVQIKLGEFSEDVARPINGRLSYINPSIKLQEGDVINYWVFVQHNQSEFRKKEWIVGKLLPSADIEKPSVSRAMSCGRTITKVLGKTNICSGDDIINYKFTETNPNAQLWLIEEFIPKDPDWEYVIYKHEPDVISVENNVLRIRPKVVAENAMKDIILTECTRGAHSAECSNIFSGIYQNPIVSGRIVSRNSFCFANITIRAKLPQGDWIFPEIYLEDIKDPKKRLLIAYARGNKKLTGATGVDIGGKMLFGGPYMNPAEPSRSSFLATHQSQNHIGADWHVFSLIWTKDQIILYVDDVNYGTIHADALRASGFDQETMVRLVLGLGVAGSNDFPDNHMSGSYIKPWKNNGLTSVKKFLQSREVWEKTWNEDSRLLVEYVTIKAL